MAKRTSGHSKAPQPKRKRLAGAERKSREETKIHKMRKDRRHNDAIGDLPATGIIVSARMIGITGLSELGDYAEELEHAAFNDRIDLAATSAARVRQQMRTVHDAARQLLAALEGCDATTRDVLRRELINMNRRRLATDIAGDLSWLRIAAGALAVVPKEVTDKNGQRRTVGIKPEDMPGVMGERTARGHALARLGAMLARLYARHHEGGEFEIGEEKDTGGLRFEGPAMPWFAAVVSMIDRTTTGTKISQAAKDGRAAFNAAAAERIAAEAAVN